MTRTTHELASPLQSTTPYQREDVLPCDLECNSPAYTASLQWNLVFEPRTFRPGGRGLSMDELASQCVAFFLAGYDTTASTLSFAAYLLALNQNIQDKLRDEVDTMLEIYNGELTYEAIQSLKYMENVIRETLRLYPPIYRLERQANADWQLGKTGIILRKGMLVTVPIYAMNRDPKYWPDPETFNPDRFETENRKEYCFLPFGTGPKACLGRRFAEMEMKVCLSYLMANFKIHTCPETKVPINFDKGLNGLLQPLDITLRMEIRENPPLIQ
ncbi:Cytochrome P450 3A13 [Araneus ventricosus]|uniref:Cytochrome P450 3A13 n=1 Tax=Araneus ventricosus TaxID=182803 RepID=A0A4Y2EFA3_ARAVE|nr:Cytochrome P450 3A13 [Araneus ventricosus]